MKKLVKGIAFLVLISFTLAFLLSGCGSSGADVTTSTGTDKVDKAADTSGNTADTKTAAQTNTSGVKKKIVVVQENEMPYVIEEQQNAVKALETSGYTKENSDLQIVKLDNDEKKCAGVVDTIKKSKPDVVVVIADRFAFTSVAKALDGTGIPVIINENAEVKAYGFIDDNSVPKGNVSGLYTMPTDMLKNSYEFLNGISPVNGKKAVFLTYPGMFTKEQVTEALNATSVQLKAYEECKNEEDFQKAVLKYNKDKDVAWVLMGLYPTIKRDGKSIDFTKCVAWQQANLIKPDISFWDICAQLGAVPCALAVDVPTLGTQCGEMAVRVLNGEDIKSIKAENPSKINIALNQKKAKIAGITFSADIMGSAAKIYTDYEGHTVK